MYILKTKKTTILFNATSNFIHFHISHLHETLFFNSLCVNNTSNLLKANYQIFERSDANIFTLDRNVMNVEKSFFFSKLI